MDKREEIRKIFEENFTIIQTEKINFDITTEEFVRPCLGNYTEFLDKKYISYVIKPIHKENVRIKLECKDDGDIKKLKFEIKIFKKFPVIFENFDFSMPIFVGNDTDETDNIYQPISFRDCNIEFVSATAINNTFVSQRISFERCDIKELQIHKTIFAEEISFYRNVILYVSLSNCVFQKNLYFNHSIFEKKIDFRESEFEKVVCFYGAKFKKAPNFSACYFKEPRAVNLVNIDIDSLDFKQVEDYIKDNFKDEWCKQEIAKSQNTNNKDKEIEIEQKYRLRYAQNAKDSFRAIKDILIGQNNTLEAQKWHKLELYAKEKEIEINLERNHKSSSNQEISIVQSSEVNSLTLVIDNILLWLYRNSSLHHTSFTRILNFSVCNIVLYSFILFFLTSNLWNLWGLLLGKFEKTDIFWFWATLVLFLCSSIYIAYITKKANTILKTISSTLLFLFLACILVGSMYRTSYTHILFFLALYIILFIALMIHAYFRYVITNKVISYFFHCVVYISLLAIIVIRPQFINPFIGIFSNDNLFENKFEQKLSDLNSSTIINLAKISQKDFTLQNNYDVSFAELNSAKMMILSNKNNITALKDENLTKATEILGHTLYSEISQVIKQDEIVGDIIKSTSIIYSIILLLCIFSLQKTARKNSIIPS